MVGHEITSSTNSGIVGELALFIIVDLNLYQMACGPRILENEDEADEDIDFECFQQIKETLHCPICYDILKDPLNVRMCLHKFCCHCIEGYNRNVYNRALFNFYPFRKK